MTETPIVLGRAAHGDRPPSRALAGARPSFHPTARKTLACAALLATVAVLASTLAGCGQKGPLVLPDSASRAERAGSSGTNGDDERDERRGETESRGDG